MIPAGKNFSATPFTLREKITQMRSLLTQPTFISMYMIAALSMGIFVSVYNYLSFLLESPLFALPHHLVAMIFMMYIAGIIGSVVAGSLSDKFAPEILLQGTLLLMGIGMSCLLVMKLWIIVLGLGILTFSFFGTHTLASRIVSIHAQNLKSSATCVYWLFYYLGSSLIGSLTGIVFVSNGWFSLVEILLLLLLGALIIASLFIFKYRFYEKAKFTAIIGMAVMMSIPVASLAGNEKQVEIVNENIRYCESTYPYNGGILIANFGTEQLNPLNAEGKGYILYYKMVKWIRWFLLMVT